MNWLVKFRQLFLSWFKPTVKPTIVCCSGGFDPIHKGHVEYIQSAAKLGNKLVVIANTDKFLLKKKGYVFMPFEERKYILEHIKGVSEVVDCIDEDQSVSKTLEMIKPDIFAKGGDRNSGNIPEKEVCDKFGIKIVDGLGDKVQSSSSLADELVAKITEAKVKERQKYMLRKFAKTGSFF
jgi:cytidyltransferase-like protein